jgi:hypothetical protein
MKAELAKQLAPLPGGFAEFKEPTAESLPLAQRIAIGGELMKTVFH